MNIQDILKRTQLRKAAGENQEYPWHAGERIPRIVPPEPRPLGTCTFVGESIPSTAVPRFRCTLYDDSTTLHTKCNQANHHCPTCKDFQNIVQFDEFNLFPQLPGKRFNPSLIRFKDEIVFCWRDGWEGSNLYCCKLDKNLNPVSDPVRLDLLNNRCTYGREDPNLFVYRNRLHVAFVGVIGAGPNFVRTYMLYARLSDDLRVEEIFTPDPPGVLAPRWQKNWGFFEGLDGELYTLYQLRPQKVLRIDGNKCEWAYEHPGFRVWTSGEPRTGAAPQYLPGTDMKRIMVRNRAVAPRTRPGEPYVVLSLYDYTGSPPEFPHDPNRVAVLPLQFQDFDPARRNYGLGETYGGVPVEDQWMRREHADQLWNFLVYHRNVPTVVVHCNAAVSRSPAVAQAVCDSWNLSRSLIDWKNDWGTQDPSVQPTNLHVYKTVCAAAPKPPEGEFWSFFHDHVYLDGRKTYRMGLYTFDPNPPFAPRRFVPESLVIADRSTNVTDPKRNLVENYCEVIFPRGAVFAGDRWYVSSGVHDRWSEIRSFAHADLLRRLKPVPTA
jgi:predicted protein tyrosine phosphatase